MKTTKIDLAYAAGFFDGEGCIHMRPNGQIHIDMTQYDTRPLQYIQEATGSILRFRKNGKEYRLKTSNRELVVKFLKLVLPYLVLKREQAQLAIEFIESKLRGRIHEPNIREQYYERMKSLKRDRR